jgi:hypothetical protein
MRRLLAAVVAGWILTCTPVTPLRAGEAKMPIAGRPTIHVLPPLADGWWEEIYGPIENALSSRETMVQFGAVGVLIGLFIIWYRRT